MKKPILISEEYSVVIDTNSLADNFVAELCAYCTGFTSEDRHRDQKFSDLFYLENGIEDDASPKGKVAHQKGPFYGFVGDRLDADENYSPCSIWLSRNYGCNASGEYARLDEKNYEQYNFPAPFSVGIFFDCEPRLEHIAMIKERAEKFFSEVWPKLSSQTVKIEDFRLITHKKYAEERNL